MKHKLQTSARAMETFSLLSILGRAVPTATLFLRKSVSSLLIVALVACAGCKSSSEEQVSLQSSPETKSADSHQGNEKGNSSFQPFGIYADKGSRENHYVPSGFMPDGKCLSFNDTWMENCHDGKTCIKLGYDVECSKAGQKWAGIYWLNPPNNWGNRKGGFSLTGAQKLTFWARGDKGGERIEEVKIGGITGEFPDSDTAVIGPIILTPEWKQYVIDLRGKDLSYISGGFTWATNVDVNPHECVFYLDDIRYE